MDSLRNKYNGDRIFLVGNGPSLQDTPLASLENEYSLAMKKINHIYGDTSWRPSFYFNPKGENLPDKQKRFIKENIDQGIICFINLYNLETFGKRKNVFYINRVGMILSPRYPNSNLHAMSVQDIAKKQLNQLQKLWSDNPGEILYTYHSMYGAMQIVEYLGFDKIYLVGCDLGYKYHDPHMIFDDGLDPYNYSLRIGDFLRNQFITFLKNSYQKGNVAKSLINSFAYIFFLTSLAEKYNNLTESVPGGDDPNHFAANYRLKPKDNTYANDQIRKSHLAAKRILDEEGIKVYNATVGGNLEIYPRVDIEDIL